MHGCNFHWGQAVFRKIQELGMQPGFQNDLGLNQYCKQILALAYLPGELIDPTLTELESEATIEGQQHLCAYVRQTWMEGSVWDPASWSSFYRAIRTNNDVEGWHRHLNSKAGRGQLNMYLLMRLLATEAALVCDNLTLLCESAVIRRQRKAARRNTQRLFKVWDELITKDKRARQTLRAVSKLLPI
ncbi:WD repeat protein [Elysia marginata]|uniref:WD repeat protein n=1 Tax=Elysia marginata TaxID=1093978 RepID=A0AAV4HJG3_9GAST|nr:WD repeat protein [Elysia marginata]